MRSNINVELNKYNNLGHFRMWCQKVLPLAYDDSLSYYELLCRVVNYLNECIKGLNLTGENVENLHNAFTLLNDYVNTYFDNLDVQNEINNKLNTMTTDGSLSALIEPIFDEYKEKILVLESRMNSFTKLVEGSTTGDAELADVRVGGNGVIYNTAGEAVREQYKEVKNSLGFERVPTDSVDVTLISNTLIKNNGELVPNVSGYTSTEKIDIRGHNRIYYVGSLDYTNCVIAFYDASDLFVSGIVSTPILESFDAFFNVPSNATYVRFCFKNGYRFGVYYGDNFDTPKLIQKTVSFDSLDDALRGVFVADSYEEIDVNFSNINKYTDSNGTVYDYTGASCSGLIDISGYDYLYLSGMWWLNISPLVLYDFGGNYVGKYPATANSVKEHYDGIFVRPSNVKYVVVNQYELPTTLAIIKSLSVPKQLKYEWSNLKWCGVGDSLTEVNIRSTKYYHDYVVETTGIQFVNMGKSGTGYARLRESNVAFYQRIKNVPLDTNVVTIFGSFNDFNSGLELGLPTDTGVSTICGCINTTIDNLYEILPLVRLGIVTPTPWGNTLTNNESNHTKYCDALIEICKRRGIPYLDLYRCSGLRPWEETFRELAYSKDEGSGTHPDETGHELIAPKFKSFLETLIM